MKRKESQLTLSRCNPGAPRALAPRRSSRGYPVAAELGRSDAWAGWLESALAAVLRPTAVAGALGLAACSLARGAESPPAATELAPEAAPIAPPAPPVPLAPIASPPLPAASLPTPLPSTPASALGGLSDLSVGGGVRAIQPPAPPLASPRRPRAHGQHARPAAPPQGLPPGDTVHLAGGARPVQLPPTDR